MQDDSEPLTRQTRSALLALLSALAIILFGLSACDIPPSEATAHSATAGSAPSEAVAGSAPREAVAGSAPSEATAPSASAQHEHSVPSEATAHSASAQHEPPAPSEATAHSIYHAPSVWTDQHGTERTLSSLSGRVQLVAMLYTSCAHACPRIMLDLKRIEGELGPELGDDVGFVIVSIDPERDTPEKLAEFATGSRLDPDRWTLLHGTEGDILELAALLGVQYRETSPGEWVHSNVITVLDRDGEIVHRQLGLGTDPAETLAVIGQELGR